VYFRAEKRLFEVKSKVGNWYRHQLFIWFYTQRM